MIEISQKDLEELARQLEMPEYPKYIGNGLYKLSENCITGRMGLEKFWKLMKDDVNNG